MNQKPVLESAGLDGWIIRLFDTIDEHNLSWLSALSRRCEQAFGDALIDLVPSYTTLLVVFDPLMVSPCEARATIYRILADLEPEDSRHAGEIHELPTWYDTSVGPELTRVAEQAGIAVNDVIDAHSQQVYRVFALGFAPGFAFMGLTDPRLECARLGTPRKKVPPGSVAMAGRQTAAYPTATPGGWNLLGRTSASLFDRNREGFSLLRVGDQVRFVPVSREAFEREGGDTTPMEPLA
ncbi:allophanate hydrolase subunit 1 [Marinobacter sp. 1_MG-2023]|uniref:5-oxoprolinase subunit B family protein n=1 Tax=Marinobacter sp. 1_MG-2023 TaxID=3062627 RepID=UPI0026E39B96|nr:allophanate hydrolase subunit 1 [Marinobacter sp. 1_MG-2023]MDO6824907.1 allophanate hydrolase subunit 1 [Marinobacter sp. 1_MG-2023]